MVDDIDLKARLMTGSDIEYKGIFIKNHNLKHIFKEIGLRKYYQFTSLIGKTCKDFLTRDALGVLKDITMYDVFCMTEDMQMLLCEILKFFTCYEWKYIDNGVFDEFYALNKNDVRVRIERESYDDFIHIVKEMYCLKDIKRESDRDDIDDRMKEILAELEQEEQMVNNAKGSNITLLSIVRGVANKHFSLNLTNIWEYTVYQLLDTYKEINKIDNENRVMGGIYAGTIDGKKVDLEKIHWATES